MKLIIDTKTLKSALAKLEKLPGSNNATITSQLVRIIAGIECITLLRFSGEGKIEIMVDAEVKNDEGEAKVDHVALFNLVKDCKEEEIEISSTDKHLLVKAGKFIGKINLIDDGEAAEPPEQDEHLDELAIKSTILAAVLRQTRVAVSTNTTKPSMCGVTVRMMDGKLCFIGTDSMRGHVLRLDEKMDVDCVIPTECVEAMLAVLEGLDEDCTFFVGKNSAGIVTPDISASFAILQDKLPNIAAALVPNSVLKNSRIEIGRAELLEAAKRCGASGEGERKVIDIYFRNKATKVVGNNTFNSEVEMEVDSKTNVSAEARLPSSNLVQALSIFDGDQIEIDVYKHCILITKDDKTIFIALSVNQPKP